MPAQLSSCHTGVVEGYVVEGHVPSEVIRQMLDESPPIRGIAVAGMPAGSPGMEHGDHRVPYDVEAFDEAGSSYVFAKR